MIGKSFIKVSFLKVKEMFTFVNHWLAASGQVNNLENFKRGRAIQYWVGKFFETTNFMQEVGVIIK